MDSEDMLYRKLQMHLDKQTIGFPKTESGSDIALLKQLFTPAQAEVVLLLTYKSESLEQIYKRADKTGRSIEEIGRLLDQTAARGIIGIKLQDGKKEYRTIPYVVGMIEGAFFTTPPESIPALGAAHARYSEDGLFWRAFMNSRIPQMRTIPIQKSITPKHHIGNCCRSSKNVFL